MLVRDADKRLDMGLALKLRQSNSFFQATSDLGLKLPVYIFDERDSTWMSTYLPKIKQNPKIELIRRKFEVIEKEDVYVIDSRINNVKNMSIINKLIEIPSFTVNASDMSDGFLNVYSRFHSSQIDKVSDLLAEYTADSENSRIGWIGPTLGIQQVMDLINSDYPLSLVSYRIPITGEGGELARVLKEPGIIGEIKSNLHGGGGVSTVLYCDHDLDGKYDSVETVSVEDGVYQMDITNRFHNTVRQKANSEHIMRSRYYIKPHLDSLEITVFLPTRRVYEYYSILYEVARSNRKEVVVNTLLPFSRGVWDFV